MQVQDPSGGLPSPEGAEFGCSPSINIMNTQLLILVLSTFACYAMLCYANHYRGPPSSKALSDGCKVAQPSTPNTMEKKTRDR